MTIDQTVTRSDAILLTHEEEEKIKLYPRKEIIIPDTPKINDIRTINSALSKENNEKFKSVTTDLYKLITKEMKKAGVSKNMLPGEGKIQLEIRKILDKHSKHP